MTRGKIYRERWRSALCFEKISTILGLQAISPFNSNRPISNRSRCRTSALCSRQGELAGRLHQSDRFRLTRRKSSVIEAFFTFAQAEQHREAQELIDAESLNFEGAKRYRTTSLRREFAGENGTELNAILPKMSPLKPQYLTKKQSVFQSIAAFVEKFKGVGGAL
jgi:hypothetical protein